jgi:hypothetical protein
MTQMTKTGRHTHQDAAEIHGRLRKAYPEVADREDRNCLAFYSAFATRKRTFHSSAMDATRKR